MLLGRIAVAFGLEGGQCALVQKLHHTVTDGQGGESIGSFKITVTGVDDPQTSVSLTNDKIAENNAVGSAIGTLSTTDPDAGNTFTYTLVSGAGSGANASFTIAGNVLMLKPTPGSAAR